MRRVNALVSYQLEITICGSFLTLNVSRVCLPRNLSLSYFSSYSFRSRLYLCQNNESKVILQRKTNEVNSIVLERRNTM